MNKKDLKLLLAKGKTEKVITTLLSITEVVDDNSALFDEVVSISSTYERFLVAKRKGIVGFEEGLLQESRVTNILLEILSKLPDNLESSNLKKPLKKGTKAVELIIDQNIDDFSSTSKENLVGVISVILNIQRQDIIIRQVARGSVKLLIELPKSEAVSLVNKFKLSASIPILPNTLNIKSMVLKKWGTFFFSYPQIFLYTVLGITLTTVSVYNKYFAYKKDSSYLESLQGKWIRENRFSSRINIDTINIQGIQLICTDADGGRFISEIKIDQYCSNKDCADINRLSGGWCFAEYKFMSQRKCCMVYLCSKDSLIYTSVDGYFTCTRKK